MSLDDDIAGHYSRSGLTKRILEALASKGVDCSSLTADDLKPVDEFHIGGIAATKALIGQLGLSPGMRVLDIGSGIGGTPRFVAGLTGAHVTGIDLTPEYTETAEALSALVGMQDCTDFLTASAIDMPFADDRFDAALLLHVGMNIPDKDALMRESARVLKPGAILAVYEIMKVGEEPIEFPVPWASVAENSFLADLNSYRRSAERAGFREIASRDQSPIAMQFFAEQKRRAAAESAPAVGLHILMGENFPTKVANMAMAVTAGRIAPTELILKLVS